VYRVAATVRRLLMQEDLDEAERHVARLPDTGDNARLSGEIALQQGRLALMRGNLADALRLAKRAVMAFQDAGAEESTGRAQLEFGLVLLGREQLSDARDYFLLVQGNTSVSAHTLARAELLGTVCLFLDGKYTRVLEAVERHRQMFSAKGFEAWLLYAGFLEARALFDLGRYTDAAAVFRRGMAQARILDRPPAFRTHHLWAARCEVYQGDTRHAEAVFASYDPDPELLFFRAEACHRDDRLQQALGYLDEALEGAGTQRPLGGELFNWSGGLAAVEDLAIGRESGEPVLRNLIRAFRGYVMAHVGRLEAGMAEVHNLTRQQRLSAIDPFRAYYFYFYSVILQGSGPDRLDDPLTVLGKSVKNLRERTGRIDEYGHKTDYLHRNYWNRRLMDTAKAHNLL
jgi:tetratricopeptide (TPR) repeat protein